MNLVLLYNLLIMTSTPPDIAEIPNYVGVIALGIGVCVFPIAGCLADLCYGRYKLIKISMWLVWVCVVIQCAMSIVFQATDELNGSSLIKAMKNGLLIFVTLGLAGFLSNIIQFGTDQLPRCLYI